MKNIYFILLLLFGCSQVEFPWDNFTFSEAKKRAMYNDKMIMIDFYTDW